jgi:fibronectin type 3 domain-containing protein
MANTVVAILNSFFNCEGTALNNIKKEFCMNKMKIVQKLMYAVVGSTLIGMVMFSGCSSSDSSSSAASALSNVFPSQLSSDAS